MGRGARLLTRRGLVVLTAVLMWTMLAAGQSAPPAKPAVPSIPKTPVPAAAAPAAAAIEVLNAAEREQLARAVDRGLNWLATRQEADGSFSAPEAGQPGITALCVLAYLSRGHLPGQGPYGERLNRAIDFVLSCQKADGLLCKVMPPPDYQHFTASHGAIYDHAMAGLMLCEVYGMADAPRAVRIRTVVTKALALTLQRQKMPAKHDPADVGGWRYYREDRSTTALSDVSITSWQLLFLRSARNAGFDIPSQPIEDAVDYIKRCYDSRLGTFVYSLDPSDRNPTVAMAGAGALSLSMAGVHDSPMARAAGNYILKHPFDRYNGEAGTGSYDRYHYCVFYCSQASFQLGGNVWQGYFPRASRALIGGQARDGSWQSESGGNGYFGNVYTSALAVLALTTPYQLLPIFQR
jgi:hypothetical protein